MRQSMRVERVTKNNLRVQRNSVELVGGLRLAVTFEQAFDQSYACEVAPEWRLHISVVGFRGDRGCCLRSGGTLSASRQ